MNKRKLVLLTMLIVLAFCIALSACAKKSQEDAGPTDAAVVTDAPAVTDNPTEKPTEKPTAAPTAAPTEAPTEEPQNDKKYTIPYVTKGLFALYEGKYNTEDGLDTESTVWKDLSGNGNDIVDLNLSDTLKWTEEGLYISAQKIILPEAIAELINDEAYTVEYTISDFEVTGTDYATFLNSDGNDNFALFYRIGTDELEFKCNNAVGQRPNMGSARDLLSDGTVTIAVTFSAGDVTELYFNGEYVADRDTGSSTNMAGNFFIGHPDSTRSYNAHVISLRIYNRVLTEKELAANHAAAGTVAPNPNYVPAE